MIFPEHTYLQPARQIAKKRFLQELSLGSPARRSLDDDVHAIYWTASLKEASLHLPPGKEVTEIEVFTLALRQPRIDEALLTAIDRSIPYHILYLLTYEGRTQAWISYKETAQANEAFRVEKYYHTDWQAAEELPLALRGMSLDEVYENLVRAIAGARLRLQGGSLRAAVQEDEQRAAIEKEIAALTKKRNREKQLNRKMELNARIKKLRRALQSASP